MPTYRVWRADLNTRFYVNSSSALEALDLVTKVIGSNKGWRVESAATVFFPEKNVVYDEAGNPLGIGEVPPT